MHEKILFSALTLALISACSSNPQEDGNRSVGNMTVIEDQQMPATESAEFGNEASSPPSEAVAKATDDGTSIPPAIRGRWGITAADCTSTHGDAKGLLEIQPATMIFYESRGTLERISEHEPTRIRATFAFEGEGMSWQRDMILDAQDDGQTLIRKELGADAAPSPIAYRRCAH